MTNPPLPVLHDAPTSQPLARARRGCPQSPDFRLFGEEALYTPRFRRNGARAAGSAPVRTGKFGPRAGHYVVATVAASASSPRSSAQMSGDCSKSSFVIAVSPCNGIAGLACRAPAPDPDAGLFWRPQNVSSLYWLQMPRSGSRRALKGVAVPAARVPPSRAWRRGRCAIRSP